ncbi:restriction endonuclease [Bradyrhizobium elkanii]|uniref:restriction endonuclease n=1 Tax=Bradyrhizobium elkanii TaxID=29448 RepID=UPI0018D74BD2|nr:restriction endonuclease [Bradyrhizobium elkanii]MCS3576548.1 hypothetical protein [Bradyrhizobium elkanii]MCS3719437.1 hypothetical protein [Bradyrhizobium elkanii]MCS4003842.1 hypothetical protein [Bradyrhizobium elkanii USDA 61]
MVDAVYQGGRNGNASDDPLPHLVGVSNQGGFRYIGTKECPNLAVLTLTTKEHDWPDNLDRETGIFTYYGDNRKPGHELHATPRFGNLLLRDMFDKAHGQRSDRALVPPVLIFSNTGTYRDVEFLGLAVPGVESLDANVDLVALWRMKDGRRFQNYQAKFTVLDCQVISKKWIEDIKAGSPLTMHCPAVWNTWVERGVSKALKAPRVLEYRSPREQLADENTGRAMIAAIQQHFAEDHYRFEACAAKIAEMMLHNIASIDLTRRVRDGGRDAIGRYRIGTGASAVLVDFALEAKCYADSNPVNVKDLSRLISRLRHRQFGVLVTTSYVATQAYQEIKEDQHPIVIIAARDIVRILKSAGLGSETAVREWLSAF